MEKVRKRVGKKLASLATGHKKERSTLHLFIHHLFVILLLPLLSLSKSFHFFVPFAEAFPFFVIVFGGVRSYSASSSIFSFFLALICPFTGCFTRDSTSGVFFSTDSGGVGLTGVSTGAFALAFARDFAIVAFLVGFLAFPISIALPLSLSTGDSSYSAFAIGFVLCYAT